MLGLLLKDFFTLKKYVKTLLGILLVYAVWSYIIGDASFLSSFTVIIFSMVTITSIAYDEQCHWNQYALTMPFPKTTHVLEKYVLGVLLCILGTLLSLAGSIFISALNHTLTEDMTMLLVISFLMFAIGLFFISVYLPLVFHFGPEKSRLVIMVVFLAPTILLSLLSKATPESLEALSEALSVLEIKPLFSLICVFVFVLLVMVISLFTSFHIFKRKEF